MKKLDGIEDKEILFMYNKIVRYWETKRDRTFNIRNSKFKSFCENKRIVLNHLKKNEMAKFKGHPTRGYQQYITYYHSESSQPASIIKHLRNCTAHCNISKKKISQRWYYCFSDQDLKGKCTMVAKIGQPNFKQLVEYLIQTEK
jgi:hypothetical protein